ncbi:MAG: hypothetical protein QF384_06260 [Alphaproteobacteria bacterium]|jgi:hypothetical protein|nr:hypothetical protein [Alphaproteobacteria bacterium]
MNKQRILATLFATAFLTLLGCEFAGPPPPDWFHSRDIHGIGP